MKKTYLLSYLCGRHTRPCWFMVLAILYITTAEAVYCFLIIRYNMFESEFWRTLLSVGSHHYCHHKVTSLRWDICSWGVVSLISQSSSCRRHSCLNRLLQQETPWTGATSSHLSPITDSNIGGAAGWSCEMGRISHFVRRCMKLLSGGWGAVGGNTWERGQNQAEVEGGGGMKPGDVPRPRNSTHPTSLTSPGHTHTVTHKGTLWVTCERQLAHVLCSVFPSREA